MSLKDKINSHLNILVRLPNWVGDIVMAIPSLKNLKEAFPKHKIIGTGKPFIKDILKSNQIFDEYIIKPPKSDGTANYLSYIQKLKDLSPASAILFTNSFSSAFDIFLARFPVRFGYKNELREIILTDSVPMPKVPMDELYSNLVQNFSCPIIHKELELPLDEKSIRIFNIVEEKYDIKDDEVILGLNPGAGFGESKKWPPHYFVKLAELLLKKYPKLRFFVFGGPGDEQRADFISNQIGDSAINLSKECLGLHNSKPFFHRMQALITTDSGLRWYGIAMQKPTFVLFGSSDPSLTNCFTDNFYPLRKPVSCSPCKNRICPTDFACMNELTPKTVFENILSLKEKIF